MSGNITGVSSSNAAIPSGAPKAPAGIGADKNAFMQLLVAQMKYQNPTSPTDGAQYMAQLAQFTQLEKLDAIGAAQAQAATWQQNLSAETMLGKTVAATAPTGKVTATVTGVRLGGPVPQLELSDGSVVAVTDVTRVAGTAAKAPAGGAAVTPAAGGPLSTPASPSIAP